MVTNKAQDINAYIAGFPDEVQKALRKIRATVKKAAPRAEEAIKYDMPAFTYKGNLVYFAAFKKHIGFYSVPTGNKAFEKEFSGYKTGKGSIQFPLDKPMPLGLITRVVKFRIRQNLEKAAAKKK
jgi:uncharacterized protein YdhG (YjbR/CyaY superfamily)